MGWHFHLAEFRADDLDTLTRILSFYRALVDPPAGGRFLVKGYHKDKEDCRGACVTYRATRRAPTAKTVPPRHETPTGHIPADWFRH